MGGEEPTADMAELREVVLESYEALARPLLGQRRGRMARRLHRRGLRWLNALLLLPWLLVGLVRMVVTRRASEVVAGAPAASSQPVPPAQRQGSTGRGGRGATDQGPAAGDRSAGQALRREVATSGVTADRAELEVAADALLAYHLGGRQTDDALLAEIQAAWVAYEAVGAERTDRALGRVAWRGRDA